MTTRPKKIAIIGGGSIGQYLLDELARDLAADTVTIWNRTAPSQELYEHPGSKMMISDQSVMDGDVLGIETSIAESCDVVARKRGLTGTSAFAPEVELVYGYDALDKAVEGADIVILTAGVPRKGAQPRKELLEANAGFIEAAAESVRTKSPDARVIIASNPVDTLTHYFAEASGLEKSHIMGLSGVLDSSRLRLSIAKKLGINTSRVVDAKVIGMHSDDMVPLLSHVRILDAEPGPDGKFGSCDLHTFLERKYDGETVEKKNEIVQSVQDQIEAEVSESTRKGGVRFQGLKGKSDHRGPANALKKMVFSLIDAMQGKKTDPIIASTWNPKAECYIGQEVQLNAQGQAIVVPIENMKLNKMESEDWKRSVEACQAAVADLPGRSGRRR